MPQPWAIWLLLAVIGLGYEAFTIWTQLPGDTLSEHVWTLESHPVYGLWFTWLLSSQLIWLNVHFLLKGEWPFDVPGIVKWAAWVLLWQALWLFAHIMTAGKWA